MNESGERLRLSHEPRDRDAILISGKLPCYRGARRLLADPHGLRRAFIGAAFTIHRDVAAAVGISSGHTSSLPSQIWI
jgi:hypothetical protein